MTLPSQSGYGKATIWCHLLISEKFIWLFSYIIEHMFFIVNKNEPRSPTKKQNTRTKFSLNRFNLHKPKKFIHKTHLWAEGESEVPPLIRGKTTHTPSPRSIASLLLCKANPCPDLISSTHTGNHTLNFLFSRLATCIRLACFALGEPINLDLVLHH